MPTKPPRATTSGCKRAPARLSDPTRAARRHRRDLDGDYPNESSYDFTTIEYTSVPSLVHANPNWTNSTFHMRVYGVLQPGMLVIEASTTLAVWAPVYTNTTPTSVLFYTDPNAGNYPRRFYRAFQLP